MKTIGRTLACVLLAAAFAKNVLAMSAGNIEFSKERSDVVFARPNVTAHKPIARMNPVVDALLRSIVNVRASTRKDSNKDVGLVESRTFGQKRIQFMLMPMMYKMGAMMTMLMILTAISAKGLLVGLMLLVLKLSGILSKWHSWHPQVVQPQYNPQPIHLFVHSIPYAAHAPTWEASATAPADHHYYYKG